MQYELSQEETDLLKAGLYFSIQSDNKFKNPKSSQPLKRLIALLLATLNLRKPKFR